MFSLPSLPFYKHYTSPGVHEEDRQSKGLPETSSFRKVAEAVPLLPRPKSYRRLQVRHHLLRAPVFLFQLLQPAHLAGAQTALELLPPVKCMFGYAHLADDFLHRRARLRLAECEGYLFVGIARLFHKITSPFTLPDY